MVADMVASIGVAGSFVQDRRRVNAAPLSLRGARRRGTVGPVESHRTEIALMSFVKRLGKHGAFPTLWSWSFRLAMIVEGRERGVATSVMHL
jgi:hypothetical protein